MRAFLLGFAFSFCALAVQPYRFLLVIGDQWEDEGSYLIERSGDFQVLAALLKTWGLPFDILRLDQQRLDAYHLLDREGRPRYGTVVWDAGAGGIKGKDIALVKELSALGVSFVVIGDAVEAPEIAELAGVRYVSEYKSRDALEFAGAHFITRGLEGRGKEVLAGAGYSMGGRKVAAEGATVLARRGAAPYLTVRSRGRRTRGVARGGAQCFAVAEPARAGPAEALPGVGAGLRGVCRVRARHHSFHGRHGHFR